MDTQRSGGLTSAEVAERLRRGEVNRTPRSHWREYALIFRRNLFTWFNAMVTPAAIALFVLNEYQGAIAVSGMAIVNTAISLFQEIKAKRHLDQLAILVETKARVLRDGLLQTIPAGDVVLGDHVLLASGEAVVADGSVLESKFLEVDEALLTGESDPVRKHPGEPLLSGSFCVAGEGVYRADKVGTEAFANHVSIEARQYRAVRSPLTIVINRLVQILSYTALGLIALYTIAYIYQGFPKDLEQQRDYVRMVAATITSMVPQGMVLTATISFTLGAIVISRRGAIVQRLNAVETMAAIDVICTDKTGTLTTNRLKLDAIDVLDAGLSEQLVHERLRAFVSASVDRDNKNIRAMKETLGETAVELLEQIPFKSQNRFSAVRVRCHGGEHVLALGAVEALRGYVAAWESRDGAHGQVLPRLQQLVESKQRLGLRLLLLTEAEASLSLSERTALPDVPLRPLALVSLSDELRPDAGEVLEALHAQGIAFKVVSGDNPATVQGTVSHLNVPLARDPVISGDELARAADPDRLILERSVFGRVTPRQKVAIVESLQRTGCHVAMIGDGVNDVLPIKRADLGIAMGEGSQASKTVSGIVLENNNFALLPETLEEGRTIVRNLRRSAKLFLVKNVYSLVLILVYYSGWLGLPFPYVPQQVTLLNWSVIGIPALVIALSRERSTAATKPRFLWEVGGFALRTGLSLALASLAILLVSAHVHAAEGAQRTMLLSTLIFLGITVLWRALRDGEPATLRGDRRVELLGILAIPVYLLAMYVPPARSFFELVPLGPADWALVLAAALAGYGLSAASDVLWRRWAEEPRNARALAGTAPQP